MFKTNIKITLRSLWRARQFSIINIGGLALGLTVFLFIAQYVTGEWNANRFHRNYGQLYRLNFESKEGKTDYLLPPGLAPAAKEKAPGVEAYVRIADGLGDGVISVEGASPAGTKTFREDNMPYVDGSFFNVFSYDLLDGRPSLQEPKTLALSESMSRKLFGEIKTAGRTLLISNQFGNTPYTVAAVYKDMPEGADLKAGILLSLQTLESAANRDENDWADPATMSSGYSQIYLKLTKGTDVKKTADLLTGYLHSVDKESVNNSVYLQPFSNLHLAPSFDYPFQTYGSLLLVTVFSGVALLILLIAWVNYINLSTAQALNRAKEVGIKKVLGAKRSQLAMQYLTETFFITVISLAIAVVLVMCLQPFFNNFTGKALSLQVLNTGWFWMGGTLLILAGSLLSGSYVAFVITAYKPVKTIRGKLTEIKEGFSLRKALVVFQFTISIVFIIATIILYRQLKYMHTEPLGMNLNELLVVKGPTVTSEGQAERNVAFKNALSQLPFVKKYAASNNVPGRGYNFSTEAVSRPNPQPGADKHSFSMFICDENFFDTYGIRFSQGGPLSNADAERSWNNVPKVILNEKAAATLGFDKGTNIIGQKIVWSDKPYEVVGIVKDYHHLSLKEAIKPTIYLGSVSFVYFTIQTESRDMQAKLARIRDLYNQYFSGNPFEYFFAGDSYDEQYTSEQKLGNVFIAAACVAVLIACMGLFGLATFSARKRIKEIGIRKVLGASVSDITGLISKDFVKLVFVAIVIASPLAWYIMNSWLKDFAYRTTINWTVFALAAALAIFIALATVSFQSIKAALANPVKSLRNE